MSDMKIAESTERFVEGIQRAASCARELAKLRKYPMWEQVTINLEMLRHEAIKIIKAPKLTESEMTIEIDKVRGRMAAATAREAAKVVIH